MSFAATLLGRPAPAARPHVRHVPRPSGPPPATRRVREVEGLVQLPRLLRASPWLLRAPRGDARVVDLPGWRTPEAVNAPLRTYLRLLGHDARPWGLGTNGGTPERDAELLVERIAADPDPRPVALVGWSLGGVIAREVARELPDRVARVVTFGTPVVGGPTYTLAASTFGEEECRRVEALVDELDADSPIRVPITAVYTRRDGVVDWRACIDHLSPDVEHVEVRATHVGLGVDPDVWWTVARALA